MEMRTVCSDTSLGFFTPELSLSLPWRAWEVLERDTYWENWVSYSYAWKILRGVEKKPLGSKVQPKSYRIPLL